MYFLNTEMHVVTFAITVIEIVMFVLQSIHFLQRPSDHKRLQYLILLVLLIIHNIVAGLFPDKNIPIPIGTQTIAAYFVGFLMSIYAVYYFYKVFELHSLKFYATYGALFFLLLPFLALFVIPYLLTGNTLLSSRMAVVIPFFYGLGYIFNTARAFIKKFRDQRQPGNPIDKTLYQNAIAAYVFAVCWASLPVVVFFGNFQVLAHSVTNAGFLVMTIVYVRSNIIQSRLEYDKLLESEKQLKELNAALKRKVRIRTKRLEALMKERETTFINLAHETKTPLTLIDNYLEDYIKKKGTSEELAIIKANVSRLTKDIVNLFDVESFKKGFNMYDHNQIVNFSDLLLNKEPLVGPYAKRKRLRLSFVIQESLFVKAHPGALDRITNNLIENAMKYSNLGGAVRVELSSMEEKIIFSVTDNGPGIPSHLHAKVFEPYFKLSVAGAAKEGIGMGLSIVKRIVNDLGGEIKLDSSANGTKMSVVLPVAIAAEQRILESEIMDETLLDESVQLHDNISITEKRHILLVEDNPEMLKFLVVKFSELYNVTHAHNGKEALEKMASLRQLDLIISDVMMPDMDGFEFCMAVQAKEYFKHIPFIFLTAKADDKIRGLEIGAIDYIEKPFKLEALIKKVDSILINLENQRAAVVTSAYQNIMGRHRVDQMGHGSNREDSFYHNCKKYHLTAREVEIIRLLMKGQPYKLIADALSISDKTVGKHVSNIFAKAGVNNKVELMNKLEATSDINADHQVFISH